MEYTENDWSSLLEAYIQNLETPKIKSLTDLVKFHEEHVELEFPPRKPEQQQPISPPLLPRRLIVIFLFQNAPTRTTSSKALKQRVS